MNNRIKQVIAWFSIIMVTITSSSSVVLAEANDGIDADEEIISVEYVEYDTFAEDKIPFESQIEPKSLVKYRVKNVKNTGETLGKILYTSDEGAPGITIGISREKSISASCSIELTAVKKAVGAALGFNVSASYSISASSSWTVPKKYKGKKVKYGYIIAKPVYNNYSFSVYIHSNRVKEAFLQNGTARKPKGRMRIEKRVKYRK